MTELATHAEGKTLERQIANWIQGRPWWQQWALKQFVTGSEPTKERVLEVADALVAGAKLDFEPVTADDFPGISSSGEAVALLEVANTDNWSSPACVDTVI